MTENLEAPATALIIGSATPNELLHRAEWPKYPNNKAFDKLGVYSKSPKVADAVIEAPATIPSIFAGPDRPHPMASALPVWEAANILAHPGRFHWKLAEDGCLVCDNPAIGGKGRAIFWINGDPEHHLLPYAMEKTVCAHSMRSISGQPLCISFMRSMPQRWNGHGKRNSRLPASRLLMILV